MILPQLETEVVIAAMSVLRKVNIASEQMEEFRRHPASDKRIIKGCSSISGFHSSGLFRGAIFAASISVVCKCLLRGLDSGVRWTTLTEPWLSRVS
jgi:hypothetical protein